MKIRLAILITALAGFNLFAVAPASASCHEIIEDGGCIESKLCGLGDRLGWDCIQ